MGVLPFSNKVRRNQDAFCFTKVCGVARMAESYDNYLLDFFLWKYKFLVIVFFSVPKLPGGMICFRRKGRFLSHILPLLGEGCK